MNGIMTGDGAHSLLLGRAQAMIKQRSFALAHEVATGQRSDPALAVQGRTQALSGLKHRLALLDAHDRTTTEAATRLGTVQAALSVMSGIAAESGPRLLGLTVQSQEAVSAALANAVPDLERAIATANANASGIFVFSGVQSQSRATVSPKELLAAILPAVDTLTRAEDVTAAVDAFFDSPAGSGGYLDQIVTGSSDPQGPISIGSNEAIRVEATMASGPIRDLLRGSVLMALAQTGMPQLDIDETVQLANMAGARLVNASAGLIDLQARHGALEAQVEHARLRHEAERSQAMQDYSALLAADPYEASVSLSDAQVRLETLYAITARLSRMSLADRL